MSEYRKFDFVCGVLAALAEGSEVVIDQRQFWRLDVVNHLRVECADAKRVIETLRSGAPMSVDVVGELRALRETIERAAAALEQKGRKR